MFKVMRDWEIISCVAPFRAGDAVDKTPSGV